MSMETRFRYRDIEHSVRLKSESDQIQSTVDGKDVLCEVLRISEMEFVFRQGENQTQVYAARGADGMIYIHCNGSVFELMALDSAYSESEVSAGKNDDGRLVAAMPGKVIKIYVELGQTVQKNQPVLILESMKMENTQEAPFAGKVVEINAKVGQQVNAGAVIVKLEKAGDNA
jgi:biotin carboxyl carrier protein